jgi:hypothetical protein
LGGVVLVFWALVLAWVSSVALVSFFVIGPHFLDRGATPLAGARVVFFSPEHRRQLREYRALCLAQGKSLIWWRFVQIFLGAFPFVMALGVALSLWAAR